MAALEQAKRNLPTAIDLASPRFSRADKDEAWYRIEAHRQAVAAAMEAFRAAEVEAEKIAVLMQDEQIVQSKLREVGGCAEDGVWVKQKGGWRCAGGGHFVADGLVK